MNNGGSRHISNPNLLSSRATFGSILAIALILAFVLGTELVNRYFLFETERLNGSWLVLVHTPLGIVLPLNAEDRASSLWTAVYPNSSWDQEDNFEFYHGSAGTEKKACQLTVLRFKTIASLHEIDEWYTKRVGKIFTRDEGWFLERNVEENWAQEVRGNSDPKALVYRRELHGRAQGILLERDTDGTSVTLYQLWQLDH